MTFDEYQQFTKTTAIYPKEKALEYVTLGLVGESGEISNKIKKVIRDDGGIPTSQKRDELKKELGDVLWYASELATVLGVPLSQIAKENMEKLTKRQKENKIKGDGDNR